MCVHCPYVNNWTHKKNSSCTHWKWGKYRQDLKCLKFLHNKINRLLECKPLLRTCVYLYICFFIPFLLFQSIRFYCFWTKMDLCMHARTHMWQITNTDANCLFISFNTIFFLLSCVLHFQIKAKTKTAVTPCHTTIFSDKIDSNRKIIWILYSSSHLWSAHARMFRNNAKHTAVWHGNRLNRHTHTSNKNRIMSVSLEISVFLFWALDLICTTDRMQLKWEITLIGECGWF